MKMWKRITIGLAVAAFAIAALAAGGVWYMFARVPGAVAIPSGWTVVKARNNLRPGFEDTYWYLRLRSPEPPEKALATLRQWFGRNRAPEWRPPAIEAIPAERMVAQPNADGEFGWSYLVDRTGYKRGWQFTYSNEPSYYYCCAFEHNGGSVIEIVFYNAL
jgi:hypothetical protein